MRSADPERFPKLDGADPRSAVGAIERQEKLNGMQGKRISRRLPELTAEPGTLLHFMLTTYRREAIPSCSPAHRGNLVADFRKMRLCFGRDLRLDELSRATIVELREWLKEGGSAPATIKNVLVRMKSVWRYATSWTKRRSCRRSRRVRLVHDAPDAWTLEELAAIVAAARQIDRPPIGGVRLTSSGRHHPGRILHGLRRRSLVSIRTCDVELAGGWLTIPGSQMKNGRGMRLRLGSEAIAAVRRIWTPSASCSFRSRGRAKRWAGISGHHPGRRRGQEFATEWSVSQAAATSLSHVASRAGMAAAVALAGHSGDYCLRFYWTRASCRITTPRPGCHRSPGSAARREAFAMKTKAPPIVLSPEELAHVRHCLDLLQERRTWWIRPRKPCARSTASVTNGRRWEAFRRGQAGWHRVDHRRAELLRRAQQVG